jgi:ankyrin repeat protein
MISSHHAYTKWGPQSRRKKVENQNPAALAIYRNQPSLFEAFLLHGPPAETRVVKLTFPASDAVTFLHLSLCSHKARRFCDTTITKMLLDHGADVNNKGNCTSTMLHYIIDEEVGIDIPPTTPWLTLFLEHGAVVDARDVIGQTPLQWAAFSNMGDAIKVLLKHGADINARSYDSGYTALKMAIVADMPDSEKVLRELGATDCHYLFWFERDL